MRGPCSPKHSSSRFTVLNNLFILTLSSLSKTLTSIPGPCSPHTTQPSALSQKSFRLVVKQTFRNSHFYAWRVLPQTPRSLSHGVKQSVIFDVKQPFKHVHFYAWAVPLHLPKHDPAKLTLSKIASFCC